MKIMVTLVDCCVPYATVVREQQAFTSAADATAYINAASAKWWALHEGDRCLIQYPDTDQYEPVKELGYDSARLELWGGEQMFDALLDHASYASLHEAHYKREYDDKGEARPGYLQVSEAYGFKPE